MANCDRGDSAGVVQRLALDVPAHANVLGFAAALRPTSGATKFAMQELHAKSLASVRAAMGSAPPPWPTMERWTGDLLEGLAHLKRHRALHLFVQIDSIQVADDGRLVVGELGAVRTFATPPPDAFALDAKALAALVAGSRSNRAHAAPEVHAAIRAGDGVSCARQVEFALGTLLVDLVLGPNAHPLSKYNGSASWCGESHFARKLLAVATRLVAVEGYPAAFAELVRSLLRRAPDERAALRDARDAARALLAAAVNRADSPGAGKAAAPPSPRARAIKAATVRSKHRVAPSASAAPPAPRQPAAHEVVAAGADENAELRRALETMRLKYKGAKAQYRAARDADDMMDALRRAKQRGNELEDELARMRGEAREAFVAAAAAREEQLANAAAEKGALVSELMQTKQELIARCFAASDGSGGAGRGGGVGDAAINPAELALLKGSLMREQRARASLAVELKRVREDARDEQQRAVAEKALVEQLVLKAKSDALNAAAAVQRRRGADALEAKLRNREVVEAQGKVSGVRKEVQRLREGLDVRTRELAAALVESEASRAAAESSKADAERVHAQKRAVQLVCVCARRCWGENEEREREREREFVAHPCENRTSPPPRSLHPPLQTARSHR